MHFHTNYVCQIIVIDTTMSGNGNDFKILSYKLRLIRSALKSKIFSANQVQLTFTDMECICIIMYICTTVANLYSGFGRFFKDQNNKK
jgi:hypothetical protein